MGPNNIDGQYVKLWHTSSNVFEIDECGRYGLTKQGAAQDKGLCSGAVLCLGLDVQLR